MNFAYDGGGLAKGGTVTFSIDGREIGGGHISATVPLLYSADETLDVGLDTGTPVSEDYEAEVHFQGTVNWVRLQTGTDSHDHLISADDRMRAATAIQ